jgi:predicted branched-subunit amino acid permease
MRPGSVFIDIGTHRAPACSTRSVLVRHLSLRFRPDTRAGFVQGTHAMGPAMIGIAAWGLVTGIFKQLSLARRTCIGYLNGDLNFVVFTQRYPKVLAEPGKEGFFFGVSATNWLAWQVSPVTGILLATQIPDAW